MPQSIYSYRGTHIHLILDDGLARKFNNAVKIQLGNSETYFEKYKKKCTDQSVINFGTRDDELDALAKVIGIINFIKGVNDGTIDYGKHEFSSPYLIKLRELD